MRRILTMGYPPQPGHCENAAEQSAGLQSRYNAQWTLVMAATTVAIVR